MPTITTSIRVDLKGIDQETDRILHSRLLRRQQAAMRYAYNRLVEGTGEKEIWHGLRRMFPLLTGRNINDAITLAKGTIESQRELLPERVKRLQRRISLAEQKMEREVGRRRGARPERVEAIQGLVQRLTNEKKVLQLHLDQGTVPPAVFGQRKTWKKLPGSLAEWRSRRSRQFFSRGNTKGGGNLHCRLLLAENGALRLSIRVPTGLKKRGNQTTTIAKWLNFETEYSRQYEPLLYQAAQNGTTRLGSYDVRLMRLSSCTYRAYVIVDESVQWPEYHTQASLPESIKTVGGVDLNLDHLAIVITDRQGQYRQHKLFKYDNLGELRQEKSKWLISNIAHEVIEWLKVHGEVLVIEDLDIANQGHGSARFNRCTVPFAYRQLATALTRHALREGLIVKRVNPAYTSWIGQLKYAAMYGISRHVAAAYVIGRRGLGLQERIPKSLIAKFPFIAGLVRADIDRLKKNLNRSKNDKMLIKQVKIRREWLRRLENFEEYLPEKGYPWLLWVTLYLAGKNISGVRVG